MKKIIALLVFVCIAAPAVVGAEASRDTMGPRDTMSTEKPAVMSTLTNPLKGVDSIGDLFYKIVDFVMSLSYVVIAFFLLLAGFKFVTAQGSDDKLTDAKNTFKYTIIGALILIGANTIIQVIRSLITDLQG